MLRVETIVDKIEVLETGVVQYRRARRVYDSDVLIAEAFHREPALMPGDELPIGLDPRVKRTCEVHWTPEVIAEHKRRRAADALAGPRR